MELGPYPAGTVANHAVIDTPGIPGFWLAGTATTHTLLRWLYKQDPALALAGTTRILIGAYSLAIAGRAVFSRETKA